MSHDLELSVLKPIDAPTVLQVDRNVYCCVRSSLVTVNKLERMGTIVETHTRYQTYMYMHTLIYACMYSSSSVCACASARTFVSVSVSVSVRVRAQCRCRLEFLAACCCICILC